MPSIIADSAETQGSGSPVLDPEQARRFFQPLYGHDALHGLWLPIWTRQDKKTHWFQLPGGLESATDDAIRRAEISDVYSGTCPMAGRPASGRGTAALAGALVALSLDIDISGSLHAKQGLARSQEDALAILRAIGPGPTLLLHSGHGLQAWWVLSEPLLITSEEVREQAKAATTAWVRRAQGIAKGLGFPGGIDSTQDLSRVLRIPGTVNRKEAHDLKPVQLLVDDGPKYLLEDLNALSPSQVDPAVPMEALLGATGAPMPDDDDALIVRANAAANGAKFSRLWAGDLSGHGGDHSAADLALCSHLAFWCHADVGSIDRLFRKSGLMRPKWNELRGSQSYGALTIARALSQGGRGHGATAEPGQGAAEEAGRQPPMELARCFLAERFTSVEGIATLRHWNGDWFAWEGRQYRERSQEAIRAEAWRYLEPQRPTPHRVNGMMDALRGLVLVEAESMPAWLGDSPRGTGQVISFANGLLDVRGFLADGQGTLVPHSPLWFSTNCLPFDYDPHAAAPEWERFVENVSGGDEAWIYTLAMFSGYLLMADYRWHNALVLQGPPRSGKGTICRVMQAVLGASNCCAPTLNSLAQPHGLVPLVGKLAAFVSDAHVGRSVDMAGVVEHLKLISGGDTISVNPKFRPQYDTRISARIVIACNEPLRFPDSSGAMHARLIYLPFRESFVGREDIGLEERMMGELPGIANWFLDGLRCLHYRGRFEQPACGSEEAAAARSLGAPIRDFLEECCELSAPSHGQAEPVGCDDLYQAWRSWCFGNGSEPGSAQGFGAKLAASCPAVRVIRPRKGEGEGHVRKRAYAGIRLRSAEVPR